MDWLELGYHLHVPQLSSDFDHQWRFPRRWTLFWIKKTFHNISTNIPGSTQGRICCLIAEDEENSKEVIFKRNLWTLAMCFIYFTYNLYFTRRIKKYLAGQCPNMRRVGKCHISFKGRVGLPNRMNFRKNSKRPSTPPHFQKIILQMFYKGYGCIYARRYEGQIE